MSKNVEAKWRIQNAWLAVLIAGLIWSICTVYELPVKPVALFLWMGAVWGVLLLPKIVQGVLGFPLVVYILLCFFEKLDRDNFLEKGWEQLYSGVAIRYHVHMKLPLPDGLRSIPGVYDASLLLKVAGVFIFVILAYACRRRVGYILALLCMAAVVGLELYHGRAPEVPAMICIFSGCVGLVSLRKAKDASRRKIAMQLMFLTMAFCVGGLVLHTWGEPFLAKHKEILSRQKQIEKQMVQKANKILRKLSGIVPGKGLPGKGGDLSMSGKVDMHEIAYRGSEAMEITAGWMGNGDKYLRGFVGNEYRDGQWSYDGKSFERWQSTLNAEEHPVQFIYGQEYYRWEDDEKQYWFIQYLDTPDDYAYFPYCCSFMDMEKTVQYHKDGGVRRNEDTLVFETSAYGGGKPWWYTENYTKEEYAEILKEGEVEEEEIWNNLSLSAKWLQDYYFDMVQSDVNLQIPKDVETLLEKYNMSEELYKIWEQLFDIYSGYGLENLDEEEVEEIRDYMQEEIPPDGSKDKLTQMQKLKVSTKIFIVQKFLRQHAAYTKKPNKDAEGDTVLEQFLFTGGTGYCVHFATAGAMLLRYLGVPARYVTGYRISQERFEHEIDGKYHCQVLDSDAHAWVEIYDTRQGWVPVDFTDGVTELDLISPSPDSTQPSGQTQAPEITEEPASMPTSEPTPADKPQETDAVKETQAPSGGIHGGDGTEGGGGRKIAGVHIPVWVFRVLICVAVFAALFALYFTVMNLRGQIRKRKRYQKDSGQAVLATTWQMMPLLRRLGIKEQPAMTDMAFADYVEETLDIFEEGELKRVMELAGKAAYYAGDMNREEAAFCRKTYDKVVRVCRERCHIPFYCL